WSGIGRVGQAGNAQPTLTVLPPSNTELSSKKTATLLCLANKGFPANWTLQWKVNGGSQGSGVTRTPGVLDSDGKYSWSSTLTLPLSEWDTATTVTCEATHSSQATVMKVLKKSEC
uniref:Ig-like domain-containing protein n=1 Tax=Lepisosteus oculatus TaxID=7918 RepID=W5MIW0_LEPOC